MDRAKAAVSEFLHKDGKHHTTVHESVNPAVKHEHVTPTHHENVTTAIDRDVHQDHYHTTVQPVHDREVLPEKHSHNVAGIQEREIHHGDNSRIKDRVHAEHAQFKHTHEVGATQHTQSTAPTVAGEHVHHHVHETIQPVIEKETIQPSVVHTTVPIHEVHHNEAKHHSASTLPAVSLHDFKKSGGVLEGRNDRVDHFEGAPRDITKTLGGQSGHGIIGGHGAKGDTHLTERDGGVTGTHGTHHNNLGDHNRSSGLTGTTGTTGTHNSHLDNHDRSGLTGTTGTTGTHHNTLGDHKTSGLTGTTGTTGAHHSSLDNTRNTSGLTGTHDSSHSRIDSHGEHAGTKKPGLMDRINPKVDADGDGKAGFMK